MQCLNFGRKLKISKFRIVFDTIQVDLSFWSAALWFYVLGVQRVLQQVMNREKFVILHLPPQIHYHVV